MRTRLIALLAVAGIGTAAAVTALAHHEPDFPGALVGVLSGENEVGPDGKKGAGDPDGLGSATAIIDADTNELCFGLTAKNVDQPVAAHIHRGKNGRNGPVVVPLTPPSSGDPGASSGCVQVDPALAAEIAHHPNQFYWNIHTTTFPGGAVRGDVDVRKD
jgi:hypothetical protein